MKKRLLVFLAVLLVLAACTPGALAYDVAAEQAEDFGTASLEYALPEQAYDAFGALSVADAAEAEQRMNGMAADLDVIDRKLDRIRKGEPFGDLRYRISLYDNAFEAVIHGRRGGWLWMRIW